LPEDYYSAKTMNKIIRSLSVFAVVIGFGGTLYAQNSATVTGVQATARVILPMALQKLTPLNFGSLTWPSSGTGTATMSPNVSGFPTPQPPTTSLGVTAVSQGSTDAQHTYGPGPATFIAKGEPGFTFNLQLPSSAIIIWENGISSPTLTVDNFTSNLPGNVGTLTLAIPSATVGTCQFMVGATVYVPTGATSGWYSGDFTVTVAY
jgi:hypothetical protein